MDGLTFEKPLGEWNHIVHQAALSAALMQRGGCDHSDRMRLAAHETPCALKVCHCSGVSLYPILLLACPASVSCKNSCQLHSLWSKFILQFWNDWCYAEEHLWPIEMHRDTLLSSLPLTFLSPLRNYVLKYHAVACVTQWIEHRPANQKVAGSIPSQGTCLVCRPVFLSRPFSLPSPLSNINK